MNVIYVPSESMEVQGTYESVHKKYGKDWYINEQGGGNGNWLLLKKGKSKSDVLVDGKSYRNFVLEHYKKDKLTEKLADKFRADLESGKVKLPS